MTLNKAYQKAISKMEENIYKIGANFPHVGIIDNNTKFNNEISSFWTGGFWPGILWLIYQETKNPKVFELATEIEEKQDALFDEFMNLHHDVGFMWLPTAVTHYKNTGAKKSFIRGYKAASILASRFNLKGKYIRAWNENIYQNCEGWAIIDCLMNLPLLYWASNETNDPRFKHIAVAHTNTVLENFCRKDGTVPHIVEFNPHTGEKIKNNGGQGKDGDSAWSRGQAWAIYGFAIAYRETKDERYIRECLKIARKFYCSLPADKIPYWDFASEEKDFFAKDTSAAAIAASGMLEATKWIENNNIKEELTNKAIDLLEVLTETCAVFDNSSEPILKNGTVCYTNNKHINVPIIYGDFYYIEALAKLNNKPTIF